MKHQSGRLNKITTKLLAQFVDRLGECDEVEIQIFDHNPLILQRGREIQTSNGQGRLVRIGILYDRQKKKYEYLMEFLVVDQRTGDDKKGMVFAYPVSFEDDINCITEACTTIVGKKITGCVPALQKNQGTVAEKWLYELLVAGYLDDPDVSPKTNQQ